MKPPRNIIRIDHDRSRTYGWRVTLQRKGEIVAKTFSDGVYGGKRKALNVAVDCRSMLLSQHSTLDHQLWVRTRLRRNNTSGIPGVGRYEVLANPNTGRRSTFWLASWVNEHGASRKRKFYVSHYGERQAKRLAVIERKSQLKRVCTIKSAQP
ncbi:MAG: AP2 domain-containing protein [Nitrospira sp. CG24E]|nr:MAG: AP2 domain-containing protein [Nitrospira sp. CG24E]